MRIVILQSMATAAVLASAIEAARRSVAQTEPAAGHDPSEPIQDGATHQSAALNPGEPS